MLQAGITNGKPRRIPTRDITITPRAADEHCPVCESKGWCGASEDGTVAFCKRIQSDQSHGDWGWVHRVEGEPRPPKGERADRVGPIDAARAAREHAAYLETHPHYRAALEALLRLPPGSSRALPLVGVMPHVDGACIYTFGEVDADERVIGISLRHSHTGRKWMSGRSQRGIYIVATWADTPGPVYLVEGASDVLAMTAAGLPAVGRPSNTGGVDHLTALLARHPDREIIVVGERDPKPDHSWPGRDGAIQTAERLAAGLGRAVRWTLPPDGSKDVRAWLIDPARGSADGPTRGRELAGLLRAASSAAHPPPGGQTTAPAGRCQPLDSGITFADLMTADLPEPEYIADGLLPVGLSLLAARPKTGKSWLALSLALAVASGRPCLGAVPTRQRPVLYLALEDTRRRLAKRGRQIIAATGWTAPAGLDLRVAWPRAGNGGLADLAEWFGDHPGGLVVVDTLARFRDPPKGRGSSYLEDYEAIGSLKSLADQSGGAALVIHHTRKGVADDPFDEVSGTLGINGAADSLWVLDRLRGQDAGTLYTTGRDLADATLTLAWDAAGGLWTLAGRADGIERMERPPESDKAEKCAAWLVSFLGQFAWPDSEVEAAAADNGFAAGVLKRAKAAQRKADPALACKPRVFGGEWWNWIDTHGYRPADRPTTYVPLSRRHGGETGETEETKGKTHTTPTSISGETGQSRHPAESKNAGNHQSRQSRQSEQPGVGQTVL